MVSKTAAATSEMAILSRVIDPNNGSLSIAAARAWLQLDFTEYDRTRLHYLALKAQEDTLTPDEQTELDNYRRVGRLLDLMRSKARRSLHKRRARA